MIAKQENALLKAVVHLLDDYDERLDHLSLQMSDGCREDEAAELDELRKELGELRRVLT